MDGLIDTLFHHHGYRWGFTACVQTALSDQRHFLTDHQIPVIISIDNRLEELGEVSRV